VQATGKPPPTPEIMMPKATCLKTTECEQVAFIPFSLSACHFFMEAPYNLHALPSQTVFELASQLHNFRLPPST